MPVARRGASPMAVRRSLNGGQARVSAKSSSWRSLEASGLRRLSKVSPIWQGDPELEDAQKGRLLHPPIPGAPRRAPSRGGYVEDACEPRTKLGDFFSI